MQKSKGKEQKYISKFKDASATVQVKTGCAQVGVRVAGYLVQGSRMLAKGGCIRYLIRD